jgi:DNA repair protein RadD
MNLRDYQQKACDALWEELCLTTNSPLAVLPTGAGKSLVIANLASRLLDLNDNSRCVIITHRKELLLQNRQELATLLKQPESNFGLFCSSLNSFTIKQITFASVQSVARNIGKFGHVNLIIVDEAHLVPRKTASSYQKILNSFKETNPRLRLIGLTATPYRLDSGSLVDGEGALFSNICYDVSIRWLISNRYLVPLVSKRSVENSMDLSSVGVVAGEFESKGTARATSSVLYGALKQCASHQNTRRSWLLFLPSIGLAEEAVNTLRSMGVRTQLVTGTTPPAQRDEYLRQFKNKQIQALVSVDVLTTGFNAPNVDMIVLLRPTKSLSLYVQMVGRGTRKYEGKQDCLVLDFGGNIERFGPVDAVEPEKKFAKDKKAAPHKFCPECGRSSPLSSSYCEDPLCGYVWPPLEKGTKALQEIASSAAILSEPELWDLRGVVVKLHVSGRTQMPMVMIEYLRRGSNKHATQFLCFDHEGFAQRQAVKWWKENMPSVETPSTSAEAADLLNFYWRKPREVVVVRNKKYYNVVGVTYEDSGQPSTVRY